MLPSLMYVILPIIGVVIGGILQYLFTRALEKRRHEQSLKTQAYVDFVRGFVGTHFTKEKRKYQELTSLLSDATTRIGIYGGKEVLKAIANAKRVAAKYNKGDASESELISSVVMIIRAMRKENLPKENIPDKEISWLLFGKG
ncbi:MAG: hypothetical protein J7K83_00135 [Candidatus Aenigmarchaeota archaeon]|nr:hypothetical protein [Candidatus Aenigmarchaeota archaeon]